MSSLRTLKTFLAVARHGSFAAAGAEIGLSAAAVGLQMRALEENLKQQLFDRGGRSVVLNTAGRRAIAQIEELVTRYEELIGGNGSDSLSGTVVMGALVSTLMGAFADALWTLKRENPGLEVKLFAGQSSDFTNRVEQAPRGRAGFASRAASARGRAESGRARRIGVGRARKPAAREDEADQWRKGARS